MNIRKAREEDVSRIAEILVYNNRINYWPIFKDTQFSFGELQVVSMAEDYLKKPEKLNSTYVYDDGVIKGLVQVDAGEIIKLYVDPFFQNQGLGEALISFAKEKGAHFLWVLEKNTAAIRFYERHGFVPTAERRFEEGTTEYLVKMEKA